MTFPFPYATISVTVERPIYDRFNDVAAWTYHRIDGCQEYPASSSETGPNVGISDVRSLLAPSGSDIQAIDRVVLHAPGAEEPPPLNSPARRAVTYQVIGRPKDWTHAMSGWRPGMSVDLEKVT